MRTSLVSILVLSCATAPQPAPESEKKPEAEVRPEKPAPPPPLPMPPGLDESAMDTSTDPCTDFYQFACGGWMATTEIPDDRPLYSRGFVAIAEQQRAEAQSDRSKTRRRASCPRAPRSRSSSATTAPTCMDEPKLEDGAKELHAPSLDDARQRRKTAKELAATLVGTLHLAKRIAVLRRRLGAGLQEQRRDDRGARSERPRACPIATTT